MPRPEGQEPQEGHEVKADLQLLHDALRNLLLDGFQETRFIGTPSGSVRKAQLDEAEVYKLLDELREIRDRNGLEDRR